MGNIAWASIPGSFFARPVLVWAVRGLLFLPGWLDGHALNSVGAPEAAAKHDTCDLLKPLRLAGTATRILSRAVEQLFPRSSTPLSLFD